MASNSTLALKDGAAVLSAIGVCRTCLMSLSLEGRPTAPHACTDTCMMKGCENPQAYIVAVDPFTLAQ